MKKIYIIPETEIIATHSSTLMAGSDGQHGGGTVFDDEDPDADDAKSYAYGWYDDDTEEMETGLVW